MHGFELVPSNLGGWSLDKHHALNIRSGTCTLQFGIKKKFLCFVLAYHPETIHAYTLNCQDKIDYIGCYNLKETQNKTVRIGQYSNRYLNSTKRWMCICFVKLLQKKKGFQHPLLRLYIWGLLKIYCMSLSLGILHKGNGENLFLSQQPPVISTIMGNGFYRSVPCGPSCSGAARDMMLFAPVALASGPDGSLYIGDFNFIRRVHPDGYTRTILELKWELRTCEFLCVYVYFQKNELSW